MGLCCWGHWTTEKDRARALGPARPLAASFRREVSSGFPNRHAEVGGGTASPRDAWELEPEAGAGSLRPRQHGHVWIWAFLSPQGRRAVAGPRPRRGEDVPWEGAQGFAEIQCTYHKTHSLKVCSSVAVVSSELCNHPHI